MQRDREFYGSVNSYRPADVIAYTHEDKSRSTLIEPIGKCDLGIVHLKLSENTVAFVKISDMAWGIYGK